VLKPFSESRQKWGKGLKFKFLFLDAQKGTSLCRTASFDVFCIKIRAGILAVDDLKNFLLPPGNKKTAE